MAKIIAIDFDGTLCKYDGAYHGPTKIDGEPIEGCASFVESLLSAGWDVRVFSSRTAYTGGKEAIEAWLKKFNVPYSSVVRAKPPAVVTLDDRAICFNGVFSDELLKQINNFKPYWQNNKNEQQVTADKEETVVVEEKPATTTKKRSKKKGKE